MEKLPEKKTWTAEKKIVVRVVINSKGAAYGPKGNLIANNEEVTLEEHESIVGFNYDVEELK